MNTNNPNQTVSSAFVTEASSHHSILDVKATFNKEQERKEKFFKEHNKLQKDGRIYAHKHNGEYVALTVSPQFEKFDTQVEEGVKDPVFALKNKGYFTISSCEGHPYGGMIKVGFGTEKCRDQFQKQIEDAQIPFITTEPHANCVNISVSHDPKTGKILKSRRLIREEVDEYWFYEEAKLFNLLFQTHFKRWYFLDVCIFKPQPWYRPIQKRKVLDSVDKKVETIDLLAKQIELMEDYGDLYSKNFLLEL